MPESGMSGSVGAAGEQSPVATRQMRNADYAPTDTPKSIRLIKCRNQTDFIAPPVLAMISSVSVTLR